MARKGKVFYNDLFAGTIEETDDGFRFTYDPGYLSNKENPAVSQTLPLQKEAFESEYMIAFFDGLIPEGWLLDIALENWKINPRDRMGLLLACCKDCIGAVRILDETNA